MKIFTYIYLSLLITTVYNTENDEERIKHNIEVLKLME